MRIARIVWRWFANEMRVYVRQIVPGHTLLSEPNELVDPVSELGKICEVEAKRDGREAKVSPQTRFGQLWCFFAMTHFGHFWSFAVAKHELTLLRTATNAP
jgi:hypothetical protein